MIDKQNSEKPEQPMPLEMSATKSLMAMLAPAAIALALGGCAGDGPVKTVAEVAGMATTPQESRKFVQDTRPTDSQYIPVGTVAKRDATRKTVPEFKAIEAQLEAQRTSNDAAGTQAKQLGSTPPPKPAEVLPTN